MPPDPEPSLVIVASTNDPREANGWGLMLASVTLPHRVVDQNLEALPEELDATEGEAANDDGAPFRFVLVVSGEDAHRALALLDVQREEDSARRGDELAAQREAREHLSAPLALLAAIGLCAVLSFVYVRSPGFDGDVSKLLRLETQRVLAGEWWRLIGAAFLHADLAHLASNLSFLLPLGFFCAARLGAGHLLFGFVASAAFGNVMSVAWHGQWHRQVGASGGAFGVLGLLAGAALASTGRRADPRFRRRAVVGALLAFLGLTAFGVAAEQVQGFDPLAMPRSTPDIAAHVFGCLAGVALGFVAVRTEGSSARRYGARDAALGVLSVIIVAVSAALARGGS